MRLQITVDAVDALHGLILTLGSAARDGGAPPVLRALTGARQAGPGAGSALSDLGLAPDALGHGPEDAGGDRGASEGSGLTATVALGELAAGGQWRGSALLRAERPGELAVTAQAAYSSAPVRLLRFSPNQPHSSCLCVGGSRRALLSHSVALLPVSSGVELKETRREAFYAHGSWRKRLSAREG